VDREDASRFRDKNGSVQSTVSGLKFSFEEKEVFDSFPLARFLICSQQTYVIF
jgi:hypothetical protein